MESTYHKIQLNNREEILTHLESTTKDLLDSISAFGPHEINNSAIEGSWTAGQVAEHLLKSESSLAKVITGGTRPTERNPAEKNDFIASVFLNFNKKLKSPDFIIPSSGPHDKALLLQKMNSTRNALIELARTVDLAPTCTDLVLPGVDELTRMEWLCFIICHSTRHIQQIRKIKLSLAGASTND